MNLAAEESSQQIYERALRLGMEDAENLSILTETRLDVSSTVYSCSALRTVIETVKHHNG